MIGEARVEGFKKPDRKARGKFVEYLYLDADQTVASLSAFEGGLIEELRTLSEEESDKGGKIGGAVGYGPLKAEGNLDKNQRARREEEVLLKRTGYSRITTLLDKLRGLDALGFIPGYTPDVYEQVEEGELYEFRAEIRLHPFHQFVSYVQGIAQTGRDWGMGDEELDYIAKEAEDAFYGKNRNKTLLTAFANAEEAEPGYKIAMSVKKENLLVDFEEFSGTATFVAQVQRKVAEGQKVPAARLVRKSPMVSPAEQQMMLRLVPALRDAPEAGDIGIEVTEEDILLSKPAIVVKPLCIYRG